MICYNLKNIQNELLFVGDDAPQEYFLASLTAPTSSRFFAICEFCYSPFIVS